MTEGFVNSLFSLKGRVALVSGASSGIGRHMALTLARAGAEVIGMARRADGLQSLVNEVAENGGRAEAIGVDLAAEDDWALPIWLELSSGTASSWKGVCWKAGRAAPACGACCRGGARCICSSSPSGPIISSASPSDFQIG